MQCEVRGEFSPFVCATPPIARKEKESASLPPSLRYSGTQPEDPREVLPSAESLEGAPEIFRAQRVQVSRRA